MKLKKLIIILLFMPLLLVSCRKENESNLVVTSFYTVNEFTKELVKDTDINVSCLIEGAVEPHEFEPSSQQIASMHNAKLIILNGYGLEEFSHVVEEDKDLASKILNASANNNPITINNSTDPHTFVSLHQALTMVTTIKEKLVEVFSDSKDKINENYNSYYSELENLDNEFKTSLENYQKSIIVGHEAFNYFKNDYNLNVLSVLGMHEEEPTASKIREIEDYIKNNNINVIYGEYFEENEAIETIASDTKITISYLYTCEMMDSSNLSYIECQRHNLETLLK